MNPFQTLGLPAARTAVAPDGSDVQVLLQLNGGGMARFELPPGATSHAVTHKTVEEIWLFLAGRGEFWRRHGPHEEIVPVESGVCITIPLGTHFQFRSFGPDALAAVGVTMPPWPGNDEANRLPGPWQSTLP